MATNTICRSLSNSLTNPFPFIHPKFRIPSNRIDPAVIELIPIDRTTIESKRPRHPGLAEAHTELVQLLKGVSIVARTKEVAATAGSMDTGRTNALKDVIYVRTTSQKSFHCLMLTLY